MMKKIDAIICADLHLREDTPICRIDNYWKAQERKVQYIRALQQKYQCLVFDGGDVFNQWKASPRLLAWAIKAMYRPITVAGNHDLPQHSLEMFHSSSLAVLEAAGVVRVNGVYEERGMTIHAVPWGEKIPTIRRGSKSYRRVLIHHVMTYDGNSPWPGAEKSVENALGILDNAQGFDLVVTGDNHKPFVVEDRGRILVNPGSVMRMTADQVDHLPRVYLWNAEGNTVEPHYLPIEAGVVSREHIEEQRVCDERIEAFVSRLHNDVELGISFEQNLEQFFLINKITPQVKQMVWEAAQNIKGRSV